MHGVLAALLLVTSAARAQDAPPANATSSELPPEEAKVVKPEGVFVPVSVMGGLRLGGAFNAGDNAPPQANNPNDARWGFDIALEGGALLEGHLYGGIIVGGTLFVSPSDTTSNVSSLLVGTEFGWLTNAHGVGGFFGLGVGYRAFFVTDSNGTANKYDSPDLLATVALHVELGSYVRMLPRIDLSLGPPPDGANTHLLITAGISFWLSDDVHARKKHP